MQLYGVIQQPARNGCPPLRTMVSASCRSLVEEAAACFSEITMPPALRNTIIRYKIHVSQHRWFPRSLLEASSRIHELQRSVCRSTYACLSPQPYRDSYAYLASYSSNDVRTVLLVGMWPLACSMFEIELSTQRVMYKPGLSCVLMSDRMHM